MSLRGEYPNLGHSPIFQLVLSIVLTTLWPQPKINKKTCFFTKVELIYKEKNIK